MSKIIEKFKEALQLDDSYSYERLQKEYEKLDNEEFELHHTYTLKQIFDQLEHMNGTDSFYNYRTIIMDHSVRAGLSFADRCFKTALCMLIDRYEKRSHQRSKDALDKIVPEELKKELQELVKICETIIQTIAKRDEDEADLDSAQTQRIIDRIKFDARISLSKFVERDIKKEKFSCADMEVLYIATRIFIFRIMIEDKNSEDENRNDYDQALSYLAFHFAQIFYEKDVPVCGEGTCYARRAIKISNIDDQQEAFHFLGICAMGKGDRQLAYDTYFTWMSRCCIGKLKGEDLPNFNGKHRKCFETVDNNLIETYMHHNFACLCSEISESYELDSISRKSFHQKAIQEIQTAIQMSNNTLALSYSAYGDILLEGSDNLKEDIQKALSQYKKYMDLACQGHRRAQQMEALRGMSSALTRLLVIEYLDAKEQSVSEIFKPDEESCGYYKELMDTVSQYKSISNKYFRQNKKLDLEEREQREKWEGMFELMEFLKKAKDKGNALKELQCLLLMIDQIATSIKKELEWKEYSPNKYQIRDDKLEQDGVRKGFPKIIAYYTTMGTIKHVFQELCQNKEGVAPREKKRDSDQDGKNCLTVMHAKYMNDPFEGLTLIRAFADEINSQVEDNIDESLRGNTNKKVLDNVLWPDNAELFREEIYDNYFVFLKSFTEEEDNLIMWNRYASDRANGGDSDGCFVKLDAESFGEHAYFCKKLEKGLQKKEDEPEDNFSLYHVIYLSGNEIVKNNGSWEPSSRLGKYYSALKDMMCELNEYLCKQEVRNAVKKEDWEGFIKCVSQFLQQSLRFIIFLFKDADYVEEKESRMVFTCRPNQQQTIRVLEKANPEKLCVNPFFQIYFTEVVFGPNVKDKNVWEPYFQYHLNNMWKKNPDLKDNPYIRPQDKYKITSSEKHYRT